MQPIDANLKWCNRGHHFVARSEFHKNKTKKDGLSVWCRDCFRTHLEENQAHVRARRKAYRESNKKAVSDGKKQWYRANRERVLRRVKDHYETNRERVLEKLRQMSNATRKVVNERQKQYRSRWTQERRERQRQYDQRKYQRVKDDPQRKANCRKLGKIYNRRHPDRVRAKAQRRRTAHGTFTGQQWIDKCRYWGWKCAYCRKSLDQTTVSLDHRKPISKGGLNWIANIVPACRYCNSAKASRSESEFRARIAVGLTKINPASVLNSFLR